MEKIVWIKIIIGIINQINAYTTLSSLNNLHKNHWIVVCKEQTDLNVIMYTIYTLQK